jgi:hypothetical protein
MLNIKQIGDFTTGKIKTFIWISEYTAKLFLDTIKLRILETVMICVFFEVGTEL